VKLPKEQLAKTTAVIFVSMEKHEALMPLIENRHPLFFLVAGKRIIEWIIEVTKKVGVERILLLLAKDEQKAFQEHLKHYSKFPEGKALPQNLEFFKFNKATGLTKADIETLQDKLMKNSLWIDGNCLFSEKFLQTFLTKGFEHEKLMLVRKNPETGKNESLGLGFFQRKYLSIALAGVKSVAEIYHRIKEELSIKTSTALLYDKERMECWQINYPWELLDANQKMIAYLEEKQEGVIEKGATIIGKVSIGRGARIRAGSYLEGPLVIGEECDIGPNCYLRKGVALGARVRIGNACELKNVIVENDTHIAHLSYVGDTIVGVKCNFGAGTITGNLRLDDQQVKAAVARAVHSTGRRKLGAIIGDNVKTAINVYFMPGVIVGNNVAIGTGVIVRRNIPNKTFVYLEQQLQTREWTPPEKK